MDYIRRVGAEYFGVPVDKGTHGSRLILVDKWGDIRGYHSTSGKAHPTEYAAIRPTLKKLLAETESPEEKEKTGSAGDSFHGDGAGEGEAVSEAETPATEPPSAATDE
jgi:hypothetical protein